MKASGSPRLVQSSMSATIAGTLEQIAMLTNWIDASSAGEGPYQKEWGWDQGKLGSFLKVQMCLASLVVHGFG